MTLALEGLVHVQLVALVAGATIEDMVLSMIAMIEHAVGVVRRRIRARRAVRRRGIGVRLEEGPTVVGRGAVAVVRVSGGVVIVYELAARIEPAETIGHHQARASWQRMLSRTCWLGVSAGEE